MRLSVHFETRDFSKPILTDGLRVTPTRLAWSAFGGPESATVQLAGQAEKLIGLSSLLRCPVTFKDPSGEPVWWGFVDQITIRIEQVEIKLDVDQLFNRVNVRYSFVSPDGRLTDISTTPNANNAVSQAEYGIKQTTLHRVGVDDEFAESLRDTFLDLHQWPASTLSQRVSLGEDQVTLHCAGWFKTLSWLPYEYLYGYAANYGPGPGVFTFGDATTSEMVCQGFYHQGGGYLEHAYFMLRNYSASRNLYARLYSHSSYSPSAVLATSDAVPASSLATNNHTWVRFTWSTPYAMPSSNTFLLIALYPSGVNATQYFSVRTDENETFPNASARYYNGSTWPFLPSITNPGGRPDLHFRFITTKDTGEQLAAIAAAGNQFFPVVQSLTTGVNTASYNILGRDCLTEAQKLMQLGTSNQRLVLANVTKDRHLVFYEQPDPATPQAYLDRHGNIFSNQAVLHKPCYPPVGKYAQLSGSGFISQPWDMHRVPLCFIESAEYFPTTGKLRIRSG